MPKLKTLSGQDLLGIFLKFGFRKVDQEGSHVKSADCFWPADEKSLTVPLHDEIDKGTLKAIFRQAVRHIPESDLYPHFYSLQESIQVQLQRPIFPRRRALTGPPTAEARATRFCSS